MNEVADGTGNGGGGGGVRTFAKNRPDGTTGKPSDPLTHEKSLKPLLRRITSSRLHADHFSSVLGERFLADLFRATVILTRPALHFHLKLDHVFIFKTNQTVVNSRFILQRALISICPISCKMVLNDETGERSNHFAT